MQQLDYRFSTPNVMAIFRWGRSNWGEDRDFRPISCFGIDDCCSVECRQQFRPWTKRHASVNSVYDNKRRRRSYQSTRIRRRQRNLIVRSGKSEAKRLRLRY